MHRKRPRPDLHAPIRPKTAYVLFVDHIRKDPALSGLSSPDLAKETERRWKELSDNERAEAWDVPAAKRMKQYREEFKRYKGTDEYSSYQKYLEDFDQKQNNTERVNSSDLDRSATSELAPSSRLSASQFLDQIESLRQENAIGKRQSTHVLDKQDMYPDTPEPIKSGMEEVRRISQNLGINPHLIRVATLPQESTTTKAVDMFHKGTGALVYFWSREEAFELIRSVYHPQGDSTPIHAADVFAMAAIGTYCDGDDNEALLEGNFLKFFVYLLSSPVQISDLHRMRLFACLAVCRFTNNVKSARSLMC